jgi:hypothetical protein
VVAFPGDYGNVNDYFWIPIVGPLVGAAIAGFFYDFFIQDILKARHTPAPGEEVGETFQETPPTRRHLQKRTTSRTSVVVEGGVAGRRML